MLLLLLFACGESPTSYNVQHDVGRLCAAWSDCREGGCSQRYSAEESRMMSSWGKGIAPKLASGADDSEAELRRMVKESGSDKIAESCKRVVGGVTPAAP